MGCGASADQDLTPRGYNRRGQQNTSDAEEEAMAQRYRQRNRRRLPTEEESEFNATKSMRRYQSMKDAEDERKLRELRESTNNTNGFSQTGSSYNLRGATGSANQRPLALSSTGSNFGMTKSSLVVPLHSPVATTGLPPHPAATEQGVIFTPTPRGGAGNERPGGPLVAPVPPPGTASSTTGHNTTLTSGGGAGEDSRSVSVFDLLHSDEDDEGDDVHTHESSPNGGPLALRDGNEESSGLPPAPSCDFGGPSLETTPIDRPLRSHNSSSVGSRAPQPGRRSVSPSPRTPAEAPPRMLHIPQVTNFEATEDGSDGSPQATPGGLPGYIHDDENDMRHITPSTVDGGPAPLPSSAALRSLTNKKGRRPSNSLSSEYSNGTSSTPRREGMKRSDGSLASLGAKLVTPTTMPMPKRSASNRRRTPNAR